MSVSKQNTKGKNNINNSKLTPFWFDARKIFAEVTAALDSPPKSQTSYEISSGPGFVCHQRERGVFFSFSCILKWTLIHSLFFGKIAKITLRHFSHQHIGWRVRYSQRKSPSLVVRHWNDQTMTFSQLSSDPTLVSPQSYDINLTQPHPSGLWYLLIKLDEIICKDLSCDKTCWWWQCRGNY